MARGSVRGAIALALVFVLAGPASARDRRGAVREGDCDGASRWRLVVRLLDTGDLGVRFVIGGGADGQRWNVFLDHNGEGFFAGSRISHDGGIVGVRRRVENAPGEDTIRGAAHNTETGETCAGRISV